MPGACGAIDCDGSDHLGRTRLIRLRRVPRPRKRRCWLGEAVGRDPEVQCATTSILEVEIIRFSGSDLKLALTRRRGGELGPLPGIGGHRAKNEPAYDE